MDTIYLNDGAARDPKTRYRTTGAVPRAHVTVAAAGERLGDLTARMYGVNTQANRERIQRANGSLDGEIRAPH